MKSYAMVLHQVRLDSKRFCCNCVRRIQIRRLLEVLGHPFSIFWDAFESFRGGLEFRGPDILGVLARAWVSLVYLGGFLRMSLAKCMLLDSRVEAQRLWTRPFFYRNLGVLKVPGLFLQDDTSLTCM